MAIKDLQHIASDFRPEEAPHRSTAATQRAKSAPVALMEFSADFKRLAQEKEALQQSLGRAMDIALSQIYENPLHAQIRHLDEQQVSALMENLRENPLASPITVRQVGQQYELIGGRHRLEAFRRLGRQTIPAVIREYGDEDAVRALVFDNLIQPSLSDFERYLSIAALRQRFGWSYSDLHEHTGLSRAWLSFLMQFARLDEEAHAAMRQRPGSLSSNQLREIAALCKDDRMLSAIVTQIARGEISVNGAIAQLRGKPPMRRAIRTEIQRPDAQRYAVLKHKDRTITVEVAPGHAAAAEALRQRILDVLHDFARQEAGQTPPNDR